MDLLITGATGFVGSHLALRWLRRHPGARAGCVVRAADAAAGLLRLRAALSRAAADEGGEAESVLARVDALPGELDDPAWVAHAQGWLRGPAELIHCAANLSFREADRASVWRSNVEGTSAMLAALPRLPGIAGFNYISTAYVAGNREGNILEGEQEQPAAFNNPYEHSKWEAERRVRSACTVAGIPWRILRPSIVIGHSRTHRLSSKSGFYQVVDTLLQLGRQPGMAGKPLLLPVATGTSIDLIPVDRVVDEVMDLVAAGAATADQTFHVVAADPLGLADVLQTLTPLSGMRVEVDGPGAAFSPLARLAMQGLRYYLPYFGYVRRFDRSNAQAALGSAPYRLDLEQLRAFVLFYIAQNGQEQRLAASA